MGTTVWAPLVKWVKDLMSQDEVGLSWNVNMRNMIWKDEVVAKILSIPIGRQDIRCWGSEYSLRSSSGIKKTPPY